MNIVLALSAVCLLFFVETKTAFAVPPPDFVYNIGSSVVQIFSFAAIGLSLAAGFLKKFFQSNPFFIRHRKFLWVVIAFAIIVISYVASSYIVSRQG